MTSSSLIKRLCDLPGPSGREEAVAEEIKREIAPIGADTITDRMGNVIAVMRFSADNDSPRKRIMISAHMDEVGFMITEVRADGTLGISNVGGISDAVLSGRRVKLMGKQGLIGGVIASKAIHLKEKEEREKAPKIDRLYIDIGAKDADEASEHAFVGAYAVFDSEYYEFGEDLVKAKALDDRMGCAAMIEMMRSLKENPISANLDVCFCFTVREEIGLSGAKAAAYRIRPDLAIVLETTAIADLPDVAEKERVGDVGKGVVVSVMDRSTIYPKEIVTAALDVAKRENIAAQVKRYVSGGNDAGTIHKTADGIKTLALSVPTRYLHSPACVASMNDYKSQKQLCEAIVRSLADSEVI